MTGGVVALAVIGCLTASCAQPAPNNAGRLPANPVEQCVRAVFDVLGSMVSRPFDDEPFQDFVTRYGTDSVVYTTYRDLFTSFHGLATTLGVRSAEDRLRAAATRDCADAR